MKAILAAAIAAAFVFVLVAAGPAGARSCNRPTAYDLTVRLPREWPVFKRALVHFWGPHWLEAAVVSFGEGSWHPNARNGQYRGTFQLGADERRRYGDGPGLWAQAKAAHRYWKRGGWIHWDCQP